MERLPRLARNVVIVVVASCGLFLLGAASRQADPKTLEAERFVLKGPGGKVRMTLELLPPFEGERGVIRLFDQQGNLKAAFNEWGLAFYDLPKKPGDGPVERATLVNLETGESKLVLRDSEENVRAYVLVNHEDVPDIGLVDREHRVRASVALSPNDLPSIAVYDSANRPPRAALRVGDAKDAPGARLQLTDAKGRIRAILSVDDGPGPTLELLDDAGKPIERSR